MPLKKAWMLSDMQNTCFPSSNSDSKNFSQLSDTLDFSSASFLLLLAFEVSKAADGESIYFLSECVIISLN